MLKYTKAVINDSIKDLRFFLHLFSIVTQIFYLAYIVYALITKTGVFYLNIALGVISLAYLVFFFVTYKSEDKKTKHTAYVVRHTKTITKLCINALTLGVAVYGLYLSTKSVDAISIVLVVLMIVFWCVQVVLEVIVFFFEHKKNLIVYGLQKDIEPISNAINKVSNLARRVVGREETENEPLPSNVERYLQKALERYNEDKNK